GRQHHQAMGDPGPGNEEALEGEKKQASGRGPLRADVEDRFLQAMRGSPAAREIAGQIGCGQIPRSRGPTMLLELERLGGRKDTVSGRLRDDQLHYRLPQSLSDHRPRLPAPEELRSYAVIGPALPPTTEGHPIVRTLCHFATPSRRTPAAR